MNFDTILFDLTLESDFERLFYQRAGEAWSLNEGDPSYERGFYEGTRWASGDRSDAVLRVLDYVMSGAAPPTDPEEVHALLGDEHWTVLSDDEHIRGFLFGTALWIAEKIALREVI